MKTSIEYIWSFNQLGVFRDKNRSAITTERVSKGILFQNFLLRIYTFNPIKEGERKRRKIQITRSSSNIHKKRRWKASML